MTNKQIAARARRLREDREDARRQHPAEAGRHRPHAGGAARGARGDRRVLLPDELSKPGPSTADRFRSTPGGTPRGRRTAHRWCRRRPLGPRIRRRASSGRSAAGSSHAAVRCGERGVRTGVCRRGGATWRWVAGRSPTDTPARSIGPGRPIAPGPPSGRTLARCRPRCDRVPPVDWGSRWRASSRASAGGW